MALGITIIVLIVLILLAYAIWGRPWLKSKPWAAGFFAWIEPVELVLFKKSETILFARLKVLTGLVLMLLTYLGTIDLSPIIPFVPDKYQGFVNAAFGLLPLLISFVGLADEKLRNMTSLPIELVAVSAKEAAKPAVAEAIAMADSTKTEAVAVVAQAKAA